MIFLPNLLWQIQHDFPLLLHLQELQEAQLDIVNIYEFGLAQLEFPFTLIVSLIGLYGMFINKNFKEVP